MGLILAEEANACIILVSQERKTSPPFPNAPEWTYARPTTGDAVRFDASLELRVEAAAQVKVDGKVVGKTHRIRVTKSKLGPDHRATNAPLFFTSNGNDPDTPLGLDLPRELIAEALELGVIRKPKGARIEASWDSSIAWRGEKALRTALRTDEDLMKDISDRVMKAIDEIARGLGHDV